MLYADWARLAPTLAESEALCAICDTPHVRAVLCSSVLEPFFICRDCAIAELMAVVAETVWPFQIGEYEQSEAEARAAYWRAVARLLAARYDTDLIESRRREQQ